MVPGQECYTIALGRDHVPVKQQSEVTIMAKGNNAQGKDRKKAKPKKAKTAPKKAAAPKKS